MRSLSRTFILPQLLTKWTSFVYGGPGSAPSNRYLWRPRGQNEHVRQRPHVSIYCALHGAYYFTDGDSRPHFKIYGYARVVAVLAQLHKDVQQAQLLRFAGTVEHSNLFGEHLDTQANTRMLSDQAHLSP